MFVVEVTVKTTYGSVPVITTLLGSDTTTSKKLFFFSGFSVLCISEQV